MGGSGRYGRMSSTIADSERVDIGDCQYRRSKNCDDAATMGLSRLLVGSGFDAVIFSDRSENSLVFVSPFSPALRICECRPVAAWPLLEAVEDVMLNIIITVGIIALMFAWVPCLNLICPPGWRSEEESSEKKQDETREKKAPVSSLSSRRLADQSRDFLHALSARGEREMPRSQGSVQNVSPGSCAE